MARKQKMYAAIAPDGWLDPFSFAPTATQARLSVGQDFAEVNETLRKGWQRAKKDYGYRVVKVEARVIK